MINLMTLPFKENSLEPSISAKTIALHYGKHHRAYVDKVNELIIGSKFQDMEIEDIILKTFSKPEHQVLYSNAGQVYAHNIYWQSVGIWNKLDDEIKEEILLAFHSDNEFKNALIDKAMGVFGSGWCWLVKNAGGNFEIMTTKNGDTPLPLGFEPILNIDVWEHAYYLDYQNQRKRYLENFVTHVLKI